MPLEPLYSGTEIQTKKIEKIIQDYIEDNWDYDDIDVGKIGFGKWGSQMMKGKSNKYTLKVYPASDKIINMVVLGHRLWQYEQLFTIDMWMRSVRINARDDEHSLYAMATYVEDFFADDPKQMLSLGISEIIPRAAQSIPDEGSEDTFHEVIDLYVKFLKKRV